VVYPIAEGQRPGHRFTNWAVAVRQGDGSAPPPRREDWSRPGRMEELMPHVRRFAVPQIDIARLIEATPEFWEYPMCDRDPLDGWSEGRATLIGDAAHPMYPVGSNGASQAILDARALADALLAESDPLAALSRYESQRVAATASIVLANRRGGPEEVIDAVEALAPEGFTDIDAVLPFQDRQQIVKGIRKVS
jgi:2-polyprenyl-6-methoxyphenol hydroxylase-like FAD-dependent oxidoreductase